MFPILTAAVVPFVQLPAEGVGDAPSPQPQDGAFVEAVERAFARACPRQDARAAVPVDKETNDAAGPTNGAWAAGLNFQPNWLPVAPDQAGLSAAENLPDALTLPAAGNAANGTIGGVESPASSPMQTAGGADPRSALEKPGFTGMAHSLRMAGLKNQLNKMAAGGKTAQAASGRAVEQNPENAEIRTGAAGMLVPSGEAMPIMAEALPAVSGKDAPSLPVKKAVNGAKTASKDALDRTEAENAFIPAERPASNQVFPVIAQPGGGAETNAVEMAANALEAGGNVDPAIVGNGAGAALNRAGRMASKAKPALLPKAADAPQTGAASMQAEAAWAANTWTAAPSLQPGITPDAAKETGTRTTVASATLAGTRMDTATAQTTSARPETATANHTTPLREGASVAHAGILPEIKAGGDHSPDQSIAGATGASRDAFAAVEPGIPRDATAVQAVFTLPVMEAAALSAPGIPAEAKPAAKAGSMPEQAPAVRGTEQKETGAARADSAQPLDSAAQNTGRYARTQAAARQESAYKGQALKPEPDAERDQDAARSHPVGGRQQAVPGAFPTVGEIPGSPPAERATVPAPADSQPSAIDPNPAEQLAQAALGSVRRGETRFHLKLRPEGMGEVAVTISTKDHDLHLTIRAASESTRDLILSEISGLKQELTQGGYRLEGFSVDVSGGQGGQAFGTRQDPGGQPERRPDARPDASAEPRGGTPAPKEARFARIPEARAGSINYRI